MPAISASLADPTLRADLAFGLERPPESGTLRIAESVQLTFGSSTLAIIHYGSHAQGSGARPESAYDFFVIVDRYREAYRTMAARSMGGFSANTARLLNHILPPNAVALRAPLSDPPTILKCGILSLRDFIRACSPRARDHFVAGRLFQAVQLVWARDPATRAAVLDALIETRARTFDWGRVFLPARFDVEGYCRALLEASFAAEIRPEAGERIAVLLDAQRDTLLRVYGALLEHLAQRGILSRDAGVYADPRPPGRLPRLRMRLYFARSNLRATLRWLKYVALFEGWLDYIVHKLERRSGVTLVLTPRERRWPLLFIWPRAVRYLLTRPQRRP